MMIKPETFHPEFTGIWIPKEIWYCNELSLLEKHFLIEIEGLDKGQGCYASNEFFSNFFGISKARSSQVINSLVSKDYLKTDLIYKPGTKEVVKRILKIGSKFPKGGSKKSKGGGKFPNCPPLENAEDTNILLTNIDTKTDTILNNIAGSNEPANPVIELFDFGKGQIPEGEPKSKKKAAGKKALTPEEEFDNKCHTSLIEVWVKEIHPDWVNPIDGAEGKSIKLIIPKIKAKLEQNGDAISIEAVTDLFRIICRNLPDFWKQQKLTGINSGFNTIIEQIKHLINNGTSSKGSASNLTTSKYAG